MLLWRIKSRPKISSNLAIWSLCLLQTSSASYTDTRLSLVSLSHLKVILQTPWANRRSRLSQFSLVLRENASAWCFTTTSWRSFHWAAKITGQWNCKTLLISDSNTLRHIKLPLCMVISHSQIAQSGSFTISRSMLLASIRRTCSFGSKSIICTLIRRTLKLHRILGLRLSSNSPTRMSTAFSPYHLVAC